MDLADIDPDKLREYHEIIRERLGIDTQEDPDPLIDMLDIAELAGLSAATPRQRRARTEEAIKAGRRPANPFPEPAPGAGSRYPDKPMWHAVTQIIPYLEATRSWPPGAVARPSTRGPRGPRAKTGRSA